MWIIKLKIRRYLRALCKIKKKPLVAVLLLQGVGGSSGGGLVGDEVGEEGGLWVESVIHEG